jgi:hypothetical protein
MQWYYALAEERRGPVAPAEILSLLRQGQLTLTSLVWRSDMTDWQPLSTVQAQLIGSATGAPPALPVIGSLECCAECSQSFPRTEMLGIDKVWVCAGCKPLYLQKLREGLPTGGGTGVWRRKRNLVVALDTPLPDRCVKCNAAVEGSRLKRSLHWHHPALYLMLIFPGLLIYALVAIAVRKRATLLVGICDQHRAKRKRSMLIAWLLAALGAAAITLAIVGVSEAAVGFLILAGVVLLLVALIWGIVGGRVVYAQRIDKSHAHIGGVCREYLDLLPEWTG